MKVIAAVLFLLSIPSFAFAHGSPAHQVSGAVSAATAAFDATQTPEARRSVETVTGTYIGHMKAQIVFTLKEKTTSFSYGCTADDSADEAVWVCTVQ